MVMCSWFWCYRDNGSWNHGYVVMCIARFMGSWDHGVIWQGFPPVLWVIEIYVVMWLQSCSHGVMATGSLGQSHGHKTVMVLAMVI